MRSFRVLLLIGIAAAALDASQAAAQARRGIPLILGIGGGKGSRQDRCDDCVPERTKSSSGYLRLGFPVTRSVVVGVQAEQWWDTFERTAGDLRSSVSTLGGFVQLHPSIPDLGIFPTWLFENVQPFVLGGAGLSRVLFAADLTSQGVQYTQMRDDVAMGWNLAGGFEVGVGPHVAFAPYASWFGTRGIVFEDQGDFNPNVVVVGLGISVF